MTLLAWASAAYVAGSWLWLTAVGDDPLEKSSRTVGALVSRGWPGVIDVGGAWGLMWPLSIGLLLIYYYGLFVRHEPQNIGGSILAEAFLCIGQMVAASLGCVAGYWISQFVSGIIGGQLTCLLVFSSYLGYVVVVGGVPSAVNLLLGALFVGMAWFAFIVGLLEWGTKTLGAPVLGTDESELFGMFAVLAVAWGYVVYGVVVGCVLPIIERRIGSGAVES